MSAVSSVQLFVQYSYHRSPYLRRSGAPFSLYGCLDVSAFVPEGSLLTIESVPCSPIENENENTTAIYHIYHILIRLARASKFLEQRIDDATHPIAHSFLLLITSLDSPRHTPLHLRHGTATVLYLSYALSSHWLIRNRCPDLRSRRRFYQSDDITPRKALVWKAVNVNRQL